MGAHMPTVGQQRHGSKDDTGGDLEDHHGHREEKDLQGPPFSMLVQHRKIMRVLPMIKSVYVHNDSVAGCPSGAHNPWIDSKKPDDLFQPQQELFG
jgi:hypothetical protein